jgi:hypothetical protein
VQSTPLGISLIREANGFVLRRKDAKGRIIAIKLSAEELFGLKANIALLTDRMILDAQVASGSVSPIVVHPVAQTQTQLDALGANLLLTVAAPSGERMTLAFPEHVAEHLAAELPPLLARLRTKTRRQ